MLSATLQCWKLLSAPPRCSTKSSSVFPARRRLSEAPVVISTAGAISLHELAAAAVPSFIISLAGVAGKRQLANALAFARATGSLVRSQRDWQPATVATDLAGLLTDEAGWRRHREGLRRFARPRATQDFLAAILHDLPVSKR